MISEEEVRHDMMHGIQFEVVFKELLEFREFDHRESDELLNSRDFFEELFLPAQELEGALLEGSISMRKVGGGGGYCLLTAGISLIFLNNN